MSGANYSALGGEGLYPGGQHKNQKVDRENEMVNPKTYGTRFHRRLVLPITSLNPFGATPPYPPSVASAFTQFAAGNVGVDWTIPLGTPGPILGPTALNTFWFLNGGGLDSSPGIVIGDNSFASAQTLYVPPIQSDSFQDWTEYFTNANNVPVTIIWGAGYTSSVGALTVTIPANTTYAITFEVISNNPPTIDILSLSNTNPSGGVLIPGLTPPGFVVLDTVSPQTYSTTLITSGNPNIVVTNGDGNPSPTVVTFGPNGFTSAGPPIQFQSALVWDPAFSQWEPSSGIMNDPNLNIGAPGLRLGSNNSIQGPTNQYIEYAIGDRTGFGVIAASLGTTALTQANTFSCFTADSRPSPNFGALARGTEDASYFSILSTSAQNPVSPFQGPGAYHFVGATSTGPLTQTVNYLVTQSGMVSLFTVTGAVGATALYQSAAGGITTLASLRALKENIGELSSDESDRAFNALRPVHFNFKEDKMNHLCRFGFIVEDTLEHLGEHEDEGIFCYNCLPEGKGLDMSHPRDFDNRALISLLVDQVKKLQQQVGELQLAQKFQDTRH